ncbi:DsbA family protein [Emcibacteraceae bacterium]|nr:DsbA family protein [Emcibacteraceae bacterium]
MIKQLNKLKVTTIIGVAFFAIFSINSIGIAQENISNSSTTLVAEMPFLNQDMVLGDPNAPVEIIEYASLTCNHCATFHNFVLPKIKDKYVDTGKVKVVMRSFLLNAIDASASILTRCVPEKRYFKFMEILFTQQTQWYDISEYQKLSGIHDQRTANNIFVQSTIDKVSKVANRLGINNRKIEACLLNEKIGDYLYSVHQEGIQKYKVTATPTILVNGNKTGNTYAAVEKAIEAALEYQ